MRRKYKKLKLELLSVVVLCCLIGCGEQEVKEEIKVSETMESEKTSKAEETSEKEESESEEMSSAKTEEVELISVYVCGAVQKEGVYELPDGSRVIDAIEASGGMTEVAHTSHLNQAEKVVDGQKICVYTVEEVEQGNAVAKDSLVDEKESSGKVNINTASKEELMKLSGIGEAKADSIISYREEEGEFESIESIMEIEGIKEGVFNKIKEEISVN